MDNQRDFYIKEKFAQDDLISKKADDVFNNFFKGELKMEENKMEEKVVDINDAKDKKFKMKKIMSFVATLVVVFLSVNVYAATQGYNNIFFIIRNLVKPETVNNRDEILSDRDITISYQPIEIANNLTIQVNGLIVNENKATLTLKIDEKYPLENCPKKFLVYDVTGERNDLLEKQESLKINDNKTTGEDSYVEELELLKFKNDTKNLKLEIFDQNDLLIVSLEIDLENKNIDVLSSQNNKLQKLSETELKEVLGYYARLLAYDAFNSEDFIYSREEAMKAALVENAMLFIVTKEEKIRENGYSVNELHSAIKEICGIYYEEPIDLKDSLIYYDKERNCYDWNDGDGMNPALCLAIQDISFYNGIYTIDYVYCFAGDGDYMDNSIEELDKFKSTIQLALNNNYKYTKYCIKNLNEMVGEKYTEENYEINDTTNKIEEENDRNDLLISDELIQFDTKFYLLDEIAIEYWDTSMGDKQIFYDLDSDGIDDVISIKVEKEINEFNDSTYENNTNIFSLNGIEFEKEYGTELYVVDLNKNDNNVEIVIFDPGPSDDPVYSIYSKIEYEMVLQGWIEGPSLRADEKGNILADFWYDDITEPSIYFKYYYINNNKFEEKLLDIEKVKDVKFKIKSELIPSNQYKTYYFAEDFNDVLNKYQNFEDGKMLRAINENDEFKILDVEMIEKKYDEDYTEKIYKIKIELNGKDVGYLYHMQWAG
ncbi:MAG: hypothetical protein IKL55_04610 [Clostridia bacterium]|nr:hypothetical protein [Clostridia bacterium]